MRLQSDRLYLKPIDESDIEDMREWRNKHHNDFFSAEEITKEQQRMWYTSYTQTHTDQMWIITKKDGTRIGTIALYSISIPNRTAKVGRILILEDHRGSNYAEEALKLVCDYAFERMRLYRLWVEAYLDNLPALSIYGNCGFVAKNRPIILLEKTNPDIDWKKPIRVEEGE